MTLRMRLFALLLLSAGLSSAESWTGFLVDSKCYDAEERNVNPRDTLTSVDRDRNMEIRYCSPGAKTKAFALVEQYGQIIRLDSSVNAKAVELIRKIGKEPLYFVTITGQMSGKTVKVDSISLER